MSNQESTELRSESKLGVRSEGLWVGPITYELYHSVYAKWWEARAIGMMPRELLPTLGFLVWRGDTPCCGAWLYTTDSQYGHAAWFLRNPELKQSDGADEEWDLLFSTMKQVAWSIGVRMIFMTVKHPILIDRIVNRGFKTSGSGFTHFICPLTGED